MAKTFRCRPFWAGLVASFVFAAPVLAQSAAPSSAQSPQSTSPVPVASTPDASANVQATPAQQTEPTIEVFGIRIGLAAPVPPSYEATAFTTLAGQPMTSVDQVMSQQFTGQP